MSKIVADNLRAPTAGVETPTRYAVQGSAKMWADLNGNGTPVLNASLNVSSVTDNGVGDYSYNFTSAMSTSALSVSYAWNQMTNIDEVSRLSSRTTTALRLNHVRIVAAAVSDTNGQTPQVFGALA